MTEFKFEIITEASPKTLQRRIETLKNQLPQRNIQNTQVTKNSNKPTYKATGIIEGETAKEIVEDITSYFPDYISIEAN